MDHAQQYKMLYCDNTVCRVNTFEHGTAGYCPACAIKGKEIR